MSGRTITTGFAVLLSVAMACSRPSPSPTAPTGENGTPTDAAADGSTLKSTAPTALNPDNDAAVPDTPTLAATAATLKFGGGNVLQYRFELYNDANVKVQDSGLMASPSFK